MVAKKQARKKAPAKAGAEDTLPVSFVKFAHEVVPDSLKRQPDESEAEWTNRVMAEHLLHEIEQKRDAIERGDGDALLSATRTAVMLRGAWPDWLSRRVAGALDRYTHHQCSTLDEAFNVSRPQGYRRPARRERWERGCTVVWYVHRLHNNNIPIDVGMFEAIGKLLGIKKGKVSEYYYWHKNNRTMFYALSASLKGESLPEELCPVFEALRSH